ncbi:hypothetical protein D043_4214A, partial [Vibrio parahaemolyticus EKP-021]
MPVVVQAFLT